MLSKLASDRHPTSKSIPKTSSSFLRRPFQVTRNRSSDWLSEFPEKGATVYQAEQFPDLNLHASGHLINQNLLIFTRRFSRNWSFHSMAKRHLTANADVAKAAGIHRTLTGGNGDLFSLVEPFRVRRNWGHAGRWAVIQDESARARYGVTGSLIAKCIASEPSPLDSAFPRRTSCPLSR